MEFARCQGKRIALAAIFAVVFSVSSYAAEESCPHCRMPRAKHPHAWVIITYENQLAKGVCSIHCAGIDMVVNKDALVHSMTVSDYNTKQQIDAYKAFWVIGGDVPGVMTLRAKWAFEKQEDAETFIREHGGETTVFEEVIRAVFVDLYEDTIAIKRLKKMADQEKKQGIE